MVVSKDFDTNKAAWLTLVGQNLKEVHDIATARSGGATDQIAQMLPYCTAAIVYAILASKENPVEGNPAH